MSDEPRPTGHTLRVLFFFQVFCFAKKNDVALVLRLHCLLTPLFRRIPTYGTPASTRGRHRHFSFPTHPSLVCFIRISNEKLRRTPPSSTRE